MLSVEQAREKLLALLRPLDAEELAIAHCFRRVAATDVYSPQPLPLFDNSSMDGYAVRSTDTAEATSETPTGLTVVGEVQAGATLDVAIEAGEAARIMTGAPLPQGADAIVPIEEAEESDEKVFVFAAVADGRYVRRVGDDVRQGDVVVEQGTELGPGELALLAAVGAWPLPVHRQPTVACLVTGNELVAPEDDPQPGEIRDSNSVALTALVEEAGGVPMVVRGVGDDVAAIRAAFEEAAEAADLIVSSGGVSVGRYDYVKEVIEELGQVDAWRVAMQPGKPVVVGSVARVPFLGLPGNPVSVHVAFEQFVRPAIRKLRGCSRLLRPLLSARLTEELSKAPGRLQFVRVRLDRGADGWQATPTGPQGSHIVSSLVGSHGVARFGVDETHLNVGEEVVIEVWQLPEEG